MIFRDLTLSALLLAVAAPAFAATTTPSVDIRLDHGSVWRTPPKITSTEGFVQIHNDGDTDDVLTAWSCPNADQTVLTGQDGKPLTQLTIPAKQTVTLAPGGVYLALTGLHYPVQRGSIMPCAFSFERAGEVGGFLNEAKKPKA